MMPWRAFLLGAALLLPCAAFPHEVLHSLERGKAIAVKVYFADGEVMAYTQAEVFSPADPEIPWQKGRTDRAGWVAFVPDQPGTWRVRVADQAGHGLDLPVEVAPSTGEEPGGSASQDQVAPSIAFVLRPLLGALFIALVFLVLVLTYRRRRSPHE